MRKVKVMQKF